MIKKLPTYFAFTFLTVTMLLIFGWYYLSWSLVTIIPLAISTTILFFQFLTIIRIHNKKIYNINRMLLLLQLILLLLFVTQLIDISWIWKWNMLLFLISTQLYLYDIMTKYHVRKIARILVVTFGFFTVLSFLLLPFFEIFLPIGLACTLFSFALVLGHLFGKRSLPLNQL